MSRFKIIAGLGNPGRRYSETRHNAGFLVIDSLVEELFKEGQQVSWKERDGAATAEVRIGFSPVLLVKPLRFMNVSGQPIQGILRFYKYSADSLIVVHDDIDLEFGRIVIKEGGGSGGHNGLKSVTNCLGSNQYVRVRVGVGRPLDFSGKDDEGESGSSSVHEMQVSDWVLTKFSVEETKELGNIIPRAVSALREVCESGVEIAQNRFNC